MLSHSCTRGSVSAFPWLFFSSQEKSLSWDEQMSLGSFRSSSWEAAWGWENKSHRDDKDSDGDAFQQFTQGIFFWFIVKFCIFFFKPIIRVISSLWGDTDFSSSTDADKKDFWVRVFWGTAEQVGPPWGLIWYCRSHKYDCWNWGLEIMLI